MNKNITIVLRRVAMSEDISQSNKENFIETGAEKGQEVSGIDADRNKNLPTHYVAIGASAGGLEAIESFFRHMREDSGLAFIVIQHLSPDYKSLMVELLSKHTKMDVKRAENNQVVEANNVYLIPPKKNLSIFHGKLILSDQETNRMGINLPVDIFLNSLAEDQNSKSIAIILSGTGSDGMRGLRTIKESGGMVMVQSEDSAKFDGMPKSSISTGLADFVMSPEDMPETLLSFIKHPNLTRRESVDDEDGLTKIFALLRDKTKVDFTYYKPSTVLRRIERRITVNQFMNIYDYVRFMETTPREVNSLYKELLIGVTNFFRDKDAFKFLSANVAVKIIEQKVKDGSEEIRVWVAGCSTGEEAYSMAIMFLEAMDAMGVKKRLKIFATDLDDDAILFASNGIYVESIAADLSPQILAKYFTRKDDVFHVSRNVREMVVFAQQNLIKDPPFTKIDLISCRNLLIYLQPILQKKVLEMFNFSLNENGYMFLGSSETTGDLSDCFETIHPKYKIYRIKYRKSPSFSTREYDYKESSRIRLGAARAELSTNALKYYENEKVYERLLDTIASDYVALVLVINEQLEILHSIGDTGTFLQFPSGKMTNDITKIIRKEFSIPMATGIQKALKSRDEVRYSNIQITSSFGVKEYRMRIKYLPLKKGREPLVAIFIEEIIKRDASDGLSTIVSFDVGKEAEQRINDLEQELQLNKESLQATIEELETSNEELQATNEELLASNEELQSTNEELQSVNEELYTVNAEYQNKIVELTELNNDLDNLLSSIQIGTLFLDEHLNIRKFTPLVTNIFRIISNDLGRSLRDITHNITNLDIHGLVVKCQNCNNVLEKEICTNEGRWFLMRVVPYQIAPKTYAGLTITFIGIDEIKNVQKELEASRNRFIETEKAANIGTWEWNINTNELLWSNVLEVFKLGKDLTVETIDDFLSVVHPLDRDNLQKAVDKSLKNRTEYFCEHRVIGSDGIERWFYEKGDIVYDSDGNPFKMLGVVHNIDIEKQFESKLIDAKATLESLMASAPAAIGMVKDRNFVFVNQTMREMTGYTEAELIGENSHIVYPSLEEYERVGKYKYSDIMKTGIGKVFTTWETKSGEQIKVMLTSVPLDRNDLSKGVVFTALNLGSIANICKSLHEGTNCTLDSYIKGM